MGRLRSGKDCSYVHWAIKFLPLALISAQTGSSLFTPGTSNGGFSSLLQSSLPNMLPPTWLILVLLLGYVTVLGPVRLLLVRFLKKRDWSWRITLSAIVIFSALSYTLALQQKGTSIVSSSISILQLGQPDTTGTPAHSHNICRSLPS